MRVPFQLVFVLCVTLGPWMAQRMMAQTVGASLQGTVSDPSGAVIPGAGVEIRSVETGAALIGTC
jgi:hypothetical protein